jgi:hypothetical protein
LHAPWNYTSSRRRTGPGGWLAHADHGDRASIEDGATWIATTRYTGWPPIALLHAIRD